MHDITKDLHHKVSGIIAISLGGLVIFVAFLK